MIFDTYLEEDKRQVLLNKIEILFEEFINVGRTRFLSEAEVYQLEKDIKALI